MIGLFLVAALNLAALNNAVEVGIVTLDPVRVHLDHPEVEHVYNLNR